MRKTIGIVRNKTTFLSEIRRQRKDHRTISVAPKASRFSKQRLGGQYEIQMTTIETPQTIKKPFIEELSTINTIQEPKPQWIFYYQQCQSLLKGVEQLRKEMLTNQNRRLTCIKVSQEKGYEMKIYDCAKEATGKIKKCQKILELIKSQAKNQTAAHAKVCNTVVFRLANDIQQTTKQLRLQQKSFVEQRKQFEMTDKPTFLDLAIDETFTMGDGFGDELIEDEAMRDLQERNEEIKNIVNSIYELNDIYKELSSLVVLQGSLLDRIDENIEVSRVAVSRGLEHLVSANKHQKKTSKCACVMTTILLLANLIVLIILCHKWFS